MSKSVDRDKKQMYEMWGTTSLTTDYGVFEKIEQKKVLQEIVNDNYYSRKHDFSKQNEIHSKIRNDNDYDDWTYGTEPTYGV